MKYWAFILVLVLNVLYIFINIKGFSLKQSEIELVNQQQRMNEYPSKFFRMANILEKRFESRFIYKIEDNFFDIFKIKTKWFFLIPLVMIGFFELLKKHKNDLLLVFLLIPLIIILFIGNSGKLGYFCLYPFLLLSLYYAFLAFLKKK